MWLKIFFINCNDVKVGGKGSGGLRKWIQLLILFALLLSCISGCKKLITIPAPNNSITSQQVFSTDQQANSAFAGIYTEMINQGFDFASGTITVYCGLSSDELVDYAGQTDQIGYQFSSNDLQINNSVVYANFWSSPYKYIYAANSAIEALNSSTGVHDSVKNELIGEAQFIRAFCYFYLTNMFEDVPLALSSDWNKTALMSKTSQADIYKQIERDLNDAIPLLASDYSVGLGERVRPNKWAAKALLSRVYLFEKKWSEAVSQSSDIISNTSLFGLDSLSQVFLNNSTEAIWQLQQNSNVEPFSGTWDGIYFLPAYLTSAYPAYVNDPSFNQYFLPYFYLTSSFSNSFEQADERRLIWCDSAVLSYVPYYYPQKYTVSQSNGIPGGQVTQYYMVLRLGEQYLIRAEAECQLGGGSLNAATTDLNAIRNRAGLPNITAASQSDLMQAIQHERQMELFCEWGARWFDLKRWGIATTVLQDKSTGAPTQNALLYPIPNLEMTADRHLTQNAGY